MNTDRPVLNKVQARQGTSIPKMRYVLMSSLALVIVAFALVFILQH
jgi:hypothetical protein